MKSSYRDILLRVFPPPRFLAMPSVGIDVSDHVVKFIEFRPGPQGFEIGQFGEVPIPDGVVVSGKIQNPKVLTEVLAGLKEKYKLHFVRATLPEESGYLFELSMPHMEGDEMLSSIEFRLEENVPIAPAEAVFGYDVLPGEAGFSPRKEGQEEQVVVSVFPSAAAESYAELFYSAGLVPLALETEPQAIARSVVPNGDLGTYLIVDFGRERSGISIVSGGVVLFATTTETGGDEITEAFEKNFAGHTPEEIVQMKNTEGIRLAEGDTDSDFGRDVHSSIDRLVREVQKHLQYWNERSAERKRKRTVSKVILCGGNANIGGLPEYLSQNLKLPASRANVWVNVFSLEHYIPKDISFQESLGYAPAIGLALGGVGRKNKMRIK